MGVPVFAAACRERNSLVTCQNLGMLSLGEPRKASALNTAITSAAALVVAKVMEEGAFCTSLAAAHSAVVLRPFDRLKAREAGSGVAGHVAGGCDGGTPSHPSLAFSRHVLGGKPLAHAGKRFLSRKGRDRAPARDLLAARLAGRRRRLVILPARGEA
ncbi:hypothetical protein C7T96_22825 [Nitratireductor sp. StC3]|nr:hypothetical protein C7T96_22825 [Nitratireductor sp. StC3]